MKTREELFKELRLKGFRLTPQREKILDIFFTLPTGEHLSAEDLQNLLRAQQSDISLATSYRTLKLLASIGVLRELAFTEDHKQYEIAWDPQAPHQHIICVDCGVTSEFFSQSVLDVSATVALERQFRLTDVQLKLFGLCQSCQQLKENAIQSTMV